MIWPIGVPIGRLNSILIGVASTNCHQRPVLASNSARPLSPCAVCNLLNSPVAVITMRPVILARNSGSQIVAHASVETVRLSANSLYERCPDPVPFAFPGSARVFLIGETTAVTQSGPGHDRVGVNPLLGRFVRPKLRYCGRLGVRY